MKNEQLNTLRALCDADGVTGFEKNVADLVRALVAPYADDCRDAKTGGLVVFKKGSRYTGIPPIMYLAHLDEVGFMIRHIEDDGTLTFEQVGMMPETLKSKTVRIDGRVPGVIGSKPVHLGEGKKGVDESALYIDVGAADKAEASSLGVYAKQAAFINDFAEYAL